MSLTFLHPILWFKRTFSKNRKLHNSFQKIWLIASASHRITLKVLYYSISKPFMIRHEFLFRLIFSPWRKHRHIYSTPKHYRYNQIMYILCKSKAQSLATTKTFLLKSARNVYHLLQCLLTY